MKQFQAANNQGGGITFDGMKAWRAKFADAEQANTRAGKANAARIAGEMRRAITDDMRIMAEKETSSQNGRKLTISLKLHYRQTKCRICFWSRTRIRRYGKKRCRYA